LHPGLSWRPACFAWVEQLEPIQLILGTIGLVAGLLVSALLMPVWSTLPDAGGAIAPFVVSVILGMLGVAALLSREEEFAQFLSRYVPVSGKSAARLARYIALDTSAIIDGRVADIAQTGFIMGTLVIASSRSSVHRRS
jgi:uncharacterized protein YacL